MQSLSKTTESKPQKFVFFSVKLQLNLSRINQTVLNSFTEVTMPYTFAVFTVYYVNTTKTLINSFTVSYISSCLDTRAYTKV